MPKKATRSLGQQMQHAEEAAEEKDLNHTSRNAIIHACCRERQMEATRSVAQRRRAEEDAEEDRIEEEARQQRLAEEEAARQAEEARLKVGQAHGASVMYLWHCSVIQYPVCSSHNRLNKGSSLATWQSMRLAAVSAWRHCNTLDTCIRMLIGWGDISSCFIALCLSEV